MMTQGEGVPTVQAKPCYARLLMELRRADDRGESPTHLAREVVKRLVGRREELAAVGFEGLSVRPLEIVVSWRDGWRVVISDLPESLEMVWFRNNAEMGRESLAFGLPSDRTLRESGVCVDEVQTAAGSGSSIK